MAHPVALNEVSAAGWVVRGALSNGGPLREEDRAIPLDVT